ncbi:MAG: hypothetical protein QOF76_1581 [Solirubrobacteraceae bacterium]|nr:hypothetical protein [Solirubrobacteraceae bacterium]
MAVSERASLERSMLALLVDHALQAEAGRTELTGADGEDISAIGRLLDDLRALNAKLEPRAVTA